MIQGTVTGLEEDELADEQREINLTESLNCGLKGSVADSSYSVRSHKWRG